MDEKIYVYSEEEMIEIIKKRCIEAISNLSIPIPEREIREFTVKIVGDAPLIMSKWIV